MQRKLAAVWQTEGLSVRLPISRIESGLSYPLRLALLDTSPLSKRGGVRGGLPCAKGCRRRPPCLYLGSLAQRELTPQPPHSMAPLCKGSWHRSRPSHGSLAQRELTPQPPIPWLPCAKGAGTRSVTEGLYEVSLHFFDEKMQREFCGKNFAERQPRARGALLR